MLLLYPGELYRLLGASSFKKSFKIPKPKGVIRRMDNTIAKKDKQ